MFRIEQNGAMSLGRSKHPTKGGSAPDEEEGCFLYELLMQNLLHNCTGVFKPICELCHLAWLDTICPSSVCLCLNFIQLTLNLVTDTRVQNLIHWIVFLKPIPSAQNPYRLPRNSNKGHSAVTVSTYRVRSSSLCQFEQLQTSPLITLSQQHLTCIFHPSSHFLIDWIPLQMAS